MSGAERFFVVPEGFLGVEGFKTSVPVPAGSWIMWDAKNNHIVIKDERGKTLVQIQPFNVVAYFEAGKNER